MIAEIHEEWTETPAQRRDRLGREIADQVAAGALISEDLVIDYGVARGLERLAWQFEIEGLLREPTVFDALDGLV